MITEIISVGTEVLMGNILNSNAKNLAKICNENGHYVYYHTVVGDNYKRAGQVINNAIKRADLIIVCGGLGPTDDDITISVIADQLSRTLIYDFEIEKNLKKYLNTDKIPDNILKQAYKIDGAKVLPNEHGSAHGNLVKIDTGKFIAVIPGPPNECLPMFIKHVIPELVKYSQPAVISKVIKLHNIDEASSVKIIDNMIKEQSDPTIAPYCKFMEVQFRISSSDKDTDVANKKIELMADKLKKFFGNNIYSFSENYNLEDEIYRLLDSNNLTISLAESCTGGMLSSKLINVEGISKYLKSSYVTYSNESKINILGVKAESINRYSPVSINVVREMLDGLFSLTGTDISIAISGVAGPGNDEYGNAEGFIVIGIRVKDDYDIKAYKFDGNRNQNREMATTAALIQLRNKILKLKNNYLSLYETNKE